MSAKTSKQWLVQVSSDENVHVLPANDLKLHLEAFCCHCQPRIQRESDYNRDLIIHNAYDGREFAEVAL